MSAPVMDFNHVQVFVQGMYAVSNTDGVHVAEMAMLREFYESCQSDAHSDTAFETLIKTEFSLAQACEALNTDALRQEFLRSCIFLAYADGNVSAPEKAKIAEFAAALSVDAATLAGLEAQVADTLMGQMAAVQNIDAVREVARKTLPQS